MQVEKLHRDAVVPHESGILLRKNGGFHSPSPFAQENLFCVLWGNEYVCDAPYQVRRRNPLNMFILFRILEGKLYFEYEGKSFTAESGNVVLINGNINHLYQAKELVTFQHFTFAGNASQAYYDFLFQRYGSLYRDKTETAFLFNNVQYELESSAPNDHKISYLVHNILSSLAMCSQKLLSSPVANAKSYILSHFQQDIRVEDIADSVSLSKYHFSRIFKAETGYSPHEYLFSVRLARARELLTGTRMTVDSIAATCGFTSTSHFIRSFKRETGTTPTMFRKFFDPTGFRQ